jgi:hypothetical protein
MNVRNTIAALGVGEHGLPGARLVRQNKRRAGCWGALPSPDVRQRAGTIRMVRLGGVCPIQGEVFRLAAHPVKDPGPRC